MAEKGGSTLSAARASVVRATSCESHALELDRKAFVQDADERRSDDERDETEGDKRSQGRSVSRLRRQRRPAAQARARRMKREERERRVKRRGAVGRRRGSWSGGRSRFEREAQPGPVRAGRTSPMRDQSEDDVLLTSERGSGFEMGAGRCRG